MKTLVLLFAISASCIYCKREVVTTPQIKSETSQKDINESIDESMAARSSAYKISYKTARFDQNIGGFIEAVPSIYTPDTKYIFPVIISLHGMGDLGNGTTDIKLLERRGISKLLADKKFPASFKAKGKTFAFIVIAPQFKKWPSASNIRNMVNHVVKNYKINKARIYLTGLSMGGGGVWDFTRYYGHDIAAIVPMAGAASADHYKAKGIADKNVHVWAFHNNDDPKVPVKYTKDYVSLINKNHSSDPAKETIFDSEDHDCWTVACDPAYRENNMNIYEWMLQYRKDPA